DADAAVERRAERDVREDTVVDGAVPEARDGIDRGEIAEAKAELQRLIERAVGAPTGPVRHRTGGDLYFGRARDAGHRGQDKCKEEPAHTPFVEASASFYEDVFKSPWRALR